MKSVNLIFGGLKLSNKVLTKYSKIYPQKSIVVPLTFPCISLGKKYNHYKKLNQKIKDIDHIHIHVLSGSCHYLYRFLDKFPEYKPKIKSQVFDSPCHVKGITPSLTKLYNIPESSSKFLIGNLFSDCVTTSDYFMNEPLINNIPTGIIISDEDQISPKKYMDRMYNNWSKHLEIKVMKTNSKHLESFKDKPEEYISFCHNIQSKLIQE